LITIRGTYNNGKSLLYVLFYVMKNANIHAFHSEERERRKDV